MQLKDNLVRIVQFNIKTSVLSSVYLHKLEGHFRQMQVRRVFYIHNINTRLQIKWYANIAWYCCYLRCLLNLALNLNVDYFQRNRFVTQIFLKLANVFRFISKKCSGPLILISTFVFLLGLVFVLVILLPFLVSTCLWHMP